jgi:hypothetical protein
MAADISMNATRSVPDHARPDPPQLAPCSMPSSSTRRVSRWLTYSDMRVNVSLPGQITVLADEVELQRVISPTCLKTPGVMARRRKPARYRRHRGQGTRSVVLIMCDHGTGVAPHALGNLDQAFFSARRCTHRRWRRWSGPMIVENPATVAGA